MRGVRTMGSAYEAGEPSVRTADASLCAQVTGRGAIHKPVIGLHRAASQSAQHGILQRSPELTCPFPKVPRTVIQIAIATSEPRPPERWGSSVAPPFAGFLAAQLPVGHKGRAGTYERARGVTTAAASSCARAGIARHCECSSATRVMSTSLETIGDHEMADDRAVIHRPAIPLASDRIRIDRKGLVRRADPWPAEICHHRLLRNRGNRPPLRIAESWPLIWPELDRVSIFVNMTMVC